MTDTIERPRLKITYATLRNDNEELHEQFERGMEKARAQLGRHYPNFINGEPRQGEGEFEDHSPIDDGLVLGYFAKGTRQDAKDAIAAARAAIPGWRDTPWQDRVAILRRAAEIISERRERPHPLGAQAARRLGHRQPVQLPDGTRRRPVGRGDHHGQHGRVQAVQRRAASGNEAV
jgi:hypothetical protein